jgi:t-SNARE complex subunit (syntaxin)
MTDWILMIEHINNAMRKMDNTRNASEQLLENANHENFDKLRNELQKLIEELTELQTVLDHQQEFAADEVTDWLSQAFTGKPSQYRRTPRMQLEKSSPKKSERAA